MTNPKLRTSLKFSEASVAGKRAYTLKDTESGEYYRFSEEEFHVAQLFDGTRSLAQILEVCETQFELGLSTSDLQEFQASLKRMDLFERNRQEQSLIMIERRKAARQSTLLSKQGSLMYKRFPLFDPDELFERVIPYIGFFWSRPFFIFSCLIMVFSSAMILYHIDEVAKGIFALYSFQAGGLMNFVVLWIVIIGIITIHELGHGLTCKYHGGEVHEMGILLLFFQPCFYCNVTDAWIFPTRGSRLWVTMAGGYIEYFIGSLAGICWLVTQETFFLHNLSFQVMLVCSLSTLVFNYNPLIKLDGYYALSDFLEIPNLKQDSAQFAKKWLQEKIFGVKNDMEVPPERLRPLLIYGLMALVYITSVMLGLFMMARGLLIDFFMEIGVVLSFFVLWKLFARNLKNTYTFTHQLALNHKGFLLSPRGIFGSIFLLGFLISLVFFIPFERKIRGNLSLEPFQIQTLRSKVGGILSKVHFKTGARVEHGMQVVTLKNKELELRLQNLQLESKMKKFEADALRAKRNLVAWQKSMEILRRQAKEIEVIKKQVRSLSVVSTVAGYYLGEALKEKKGTQLPEGAELGTIIDLSKMFAVSKVDQAEVGLVKVGDPISMRFYASPRQVVEGRITEVKILGEKGAVKTRYQVKALLDNKGQILKPGMTGLSIIKAGEESAFHWGLRVLKGFLRLDLFL